MQLTQHTIQVGGNSLHYHKTAESSRTTYYFLSGWGVPYTVFDMYLLAEKIIQTGGKIVFIDRFGQGKNGQVNGQRSFSQILSEIDPIIQLEKSQKNVLIGHSIGGFYACEYAKQYGGLDALFLLDVAPLTKLGRHLFSFNYIFAYFFAAMRKWGMLKHVTAQTLGAISKIKDTALIPLSHRQTALTCCKESLYNPTVLRELNSFQKQLKTLYQHVETLSALSVTNIVRKQTYPFGRAMQKALSEKGVQMNLTSVGKSGHYVHNEKTQEVFHIICQHMNLHKFQ